MRNWVRVKMDGYQLVFKDCFCFFAHLNYDWLLLFGVICMMTCFNAVFSSALVFNIVVFCTRWCGWWNATAIVFYLLMRLSKYTNCVALLIWREKHAHHFHKICKAISYHYTAHCLNFIYRCKKQLAHLKLNSIRPEVKISRFPGAYN